MKVLTRDFGEVEVTENDIITFEQKIFGFEEYGSDFIILYDDDFNGEYAWLQSVNESGLCFILANAELVIGEYNPKCEKEAAKVIGEGNYEYWLVTVIRENLKDSTVNLKSPVVINVDNRKAMQIISEESLPIRYKLFDGGKE